MFAKLMIGAAAVLAAIEADGLETSIRLDTNGARIQSVAA